MTTRCEIAFGGAIRSAEDEDRLAQALTELCLPVSCEEQSEIGPDEPPQGDGAVLETRDFYQSQLADAVQQERPFVLQAWEPEFGPSVFGDLPKLLTELGLTWRTYSNGYDVEEGWGGQPLLMLGGALPERFADDRGWALCTESREPLISCSLPFDRDNAVMHAQHAFAVASYQLPALTRAPRAA